MASEIFRPFTYLIFPGILEQTLDLYLSKEFFPVKYFFQAFLCSRKGGIPIIRTDYLDNLMVLLDELSRVIKGVVIF